MASQVITNGYLLLNAVDLSAYVKSMRLNYLSELHDDSAMGDTSRVRIGGVKDWSLEVEFNQDYAASAVNATLFSLVGTTFTVAMKPVNAATAATNPQYSGTGILESYPPINATYGEHHKVSITIQGAGTLSQATS